MKLIDALEVLKRPISDRASELTMFLACGFTPLHLQTFLAAKLRILNPERRVAIKAGLFGDLAGNLERLDPSAIDYVVVVIEWSDLDTRLGIRTLGGWSPIELGRVVESAGIAAARLQRSLVEISRHVPIVVCMPTLPLPPMFPALPTQAGSAETHLHCMVASLAASLSDQPSIRVASAQHLNELSPVLARYDVKSDLNTGFPYSLQHASVLGDLMADLAQSRPPRKGLITDLDDTLWAGIIGEDGLEGISWHLDRHTQMHGLYQQFLESLAGTGVLVGVASKNDPAVVDRAFERSDLLLTKNNIFPFEVHWSRKSESVARILKTWNISPDSVVFIDDSPMEVAEVQQAFPEMECITFPKNDYRSIWDLLKYLRSIFGKAFVGGEDTLRLASIRNAGVLQVAGQGGSLEDFLKTSDASITFASGQADGDTRAFELVNKTNQFNLNGRRFSEAEWRRFLADPKAFLFTASYKDRYGPLGKVAVIMGTCDARKANVTSWVMSCRAFSRRIEHQCLNFLFDALGIDEITFDYEATSRNGPLTQFFEELLSTFSASNVSLTKEQFVTHAPSLFHRIEGVANV
jgi:FkbH-like protein